MTFYILNILLTFPCLFAWEPWDAAGVSCDFQLCWYIYRVHSHCFVYSFQNCFWRNGNNYDFDHTFNFCSGKALKENIFLYVRKCLNLLGGWRLSDKELNSKQLLYFEISPWCFLVCLFCADDTMIGGNIFISCKCWVLIESNLLVMGWK